MSQRNDRGARSTFGPSALITPANAVTFVRLLATPVLVLLILAGGRGWAPFTVALAIGVTDGLDGWLARRQGTTRSGAFLDPLADKAAVVGALCALAAKGEVSWLPVLVIAAREVWMSVHRVVLARRGISVPARPSAKVKTIVQGVAVLLYLAPPVAGHQVVLDIAIWVAVAFTVVTGGQYLHDGRSAAAQSGASESASRTPGGTMTRHGAGAAG